MGSMFKPATRKKLFLRMALCSPAGYGKSYTALVFADTIAEIFGTQFAAIDTEHGALSKYVGTVVKKFEVCELQHYAPSAYTAAIREAAANGFGVLIIDSLSHAWSGVGGALAQVDAKSAGGGNSYTAWKDVTPQHNELVEAILSYPGHVIATMRTKMEYVLEEEVNSKGRKVMVPKKIGMKPVQREGMDYEFDVVGDMDEQHTLIISKTRCPAIDGQRVVKPGPEFLTPVLKWLGEGEDAPEGPKFTTVAATTAAPAAASTTTEENAQGDADTVANRKMASDVQVSEILVAIQVLELKGQPEAMLKKRGVERLEQLSWKEAEGILSNLRPRIKARKDELDAKLAEESKARVEKMASETLATTARVDLDQVGSIDEESTKKIMAYCTKLQIGDADLQRILAKRKTREGNPVRCIPDLSYNQAAAMIENLREAAHKRFPDSAPF